MKSKRKPHKPTKNVVRPAKATAIVRVNPAPERPWLLNENEVAIVKNSIAKGCSDQELQFCLTVARRYRLDPFKQQIWFVKRWDKNADNGNGGKGCHVWTPQVGINGLLFAAGRDHKASLGSVSLPEFGPMIKGAPEWARVKVWKKGEEHPTEAEAWWSEYAPADLSKAPFWSKMPRRMLAKCATALAIRQAYPDLGGLYIPEEMEKMSEDVTPNGRQIFDPVRAKMLQEPAREVTTEDLKRYESITATPWKEGRDALSGESGLAIIKSEFAPEIVAELGILHNAREKVTHIPVANLFKLIDRAKVCNVDVRLAEPISTVPTGGSAGGTEPQRGAAAGANMSTNVDPTLNTREWATLKRVMPRDVYEEALYFESLVAEHSGIPARFQGIGHCVSVWSIIMEHLRESEPLLVALAKDWADKNSGPSTPSTSSE